MAARGTRAVVAQGGDYSLCPLAPPLLPPEELDRYLEPVWEGTQPLTVVIASLQGRHTIPFSLMRAAGIIAIVVPAAIALTLNRYIVSGLLSGSVK